MPRLSFAVAVVLSCVLSAPGQTFKAAVVSDADGSRRGESLSIRVKAMSVPGRVFKDVGGSLSDWKWV